MDFKFNVGDVVQITSKKHPKERGIYFVPPMDTYKGKIVTIKSRFCSCEGIPYYKVEEGNSWNFDEKWLIPIFPKPNNWDEYNNICRQWADIAKASLQLNKSILIHCPDPYTTTIANKETKTIGEAKWNGKDRFDIDIGTGLAYLRSMGVEPPKPPMYKEVPLNTLKIGTKFITDIDDIHSEYQVFATLTLNNNYICKSDLDAYEEFNRYTNVFVKSK